MKLFMLACKTSREIVILLTLIISLITPAYGKSAIDDVQHGHILLEQWRIEEADNLAQSLVQHDPESGDAHFLKARVQFFKGQYEESWKTLKRISAKHAEVNEFKTLVDQTRRTTSTFATHESEHFIFRFTKGPDAILVHYAEEVLERSWLLLGKTFEYFPKEKVLVEFYPDKESFSRISPLTLQDILTSGTVALCKYNRIMMISPASMVRGYNWMDTLSHEFTHYLITRKSHNSIPLWMNEGIAKNFETRWRGSLSPMEPIMESILAQGLANDYLIPLEKMMPSLAKLKTAEDVQLAFAQVTTMIDYMADLKGDKVIPSILNDLAANMPVEKTLLKHLAMDLDTFQKEWKKNIAQKQLKTIPGLKLVNIRFKDSKQSEEDEKEFSGTDGKTVQNMALLGDVLKSRDHIKAAIIEYKKALKESSSVSPILHNKLAGAYLLTKEYELAEPLLKESLKYYPNFHTTLVNLGELYYATEKYKLAGELFESAVRINPFNPFVHQRLIAIDQKLGNINALEIQGKLYKFLE